MTAKAKPSAKVQVKASRPAPSRKAPQPADVIPGEIILGTGDIVALQGRRTVEVTVANVGDRPIQVGSHCHFFEANRSLRFDREKAYGFRLLVPAGTAVRFEPGEEKRVALVALGGNRVAYGINGLTHGRLDDPQVKAQAMARAAERGFLVKGARP
nr:urease subunit beta [Nitrospirota bacterium]